VQYRPAINISLPRSEEKPFRTSGGTVVFPLADPDMRIDFKIKKFCPHCKHQSVQVYLTHHAYDEGQGELWDGYPETAKEPAAYFVFTCNTCDEVLVYPYYPDD